MAALTLGVAAVMALIAVVDWQLGSTAEYLNAHEILRHTLGSAPAETGNAFVIGQARLGRFAL